MSKTKVSQIRIAHINGTDTLIMWTYNGYDCELRLAKIINHDEANELVNGMDEIFHEESQVLVDDERGFNYSEDSNY